MKSQVTERRYDLDWLRVIAFSLLILFHTGMMFNTWHWHVKNNETSVIPEFLMIFLNQWRMPLLFFISGAAIWFALDRYSAGRFVWERHTRLLLPLIFGMLVVIPPQVYYERLFQGQSFDSFGQFYRTVLELKPYPAGNFSWHHLWYIPYIFVYSLIALPVFVFLKKQAFKNPFNKIFSKWWSVILLFLPLAASENILRPFWPDNANNLFGDWAQFSTTLIIFCYGFIFAGHTAVWNVLEKNRNRFFAFALTLMPLMFFSWYSDFEPGPAEFAVYRTIRTLHVWCWILTALGFARVYLNVNHPFLKYATEAVYPFYILHQTITVIVGFYISDWALNIFIKFLLVAGATFLGSWILYEGLIAKNNFLRVCFGLKIRSTSLAPDRSNIKLEADPKI